MKRFSILPAIVLFIAIIVFAAGCSKGGGNSSPTPVTNTSKTTITSLSINSGPYTAVVTITGTGFSTTLTDNKVSFNGVAAVVTAASATQLQTAVPLAAGTGAVTVAVNGTTVTGPLFTYQLSPVVSTFAGSGAVGKADGAGSAASFNSPACVAVDKNGNVYVSDQLNHSIRKITTGGVVTTLAGTGTAGSVNGTGTSASFKDPAGLRTDTLGNIYVADFGNNLIRKIDANSVVTTIAGSGKLGSANGTGIAASFNGPTDVAIDKSGNLFVVDYVNNLIRKINPAGAVTTFAGNLSQGAVNGTGAAASFSFPAALVLDASNNLFVVDSFNYLIRKITTAALVSTFAGNGVSGSSNGLGTMASFNAPYYIAIDKSNNLFVTDYKIGIIRKIDPSGLVTNYAGSGSKGNANGAATTASFNTPIGIAVDAAGNIYIADTGNNIIRKISMQ